MQLSLIPLLDETLHNQLNNEVEGLSLDKDDFHFYLFLLTFSITEDFFYKNHSSIYPTYSKFKDTFNV